MKELILQLRKVATISVCLVVTAMVVLSCKKSEEEKGLSPPKWIQGEWECCGVEGIMASTYFKFVSNDVFSNESGDISSFYDLYEDGNFLLEETIKTDEIYEITIIRNNSKKGYNFKKGDDKTHIEFYLLNNDYIQILYKK